MPYYPSMQQMGRNPNMPTYDPQSPRMDFASWAAAMYKNLQEAKDRKTTEAQMAEEQRWQEQLKPLQIRQMEAGVKKTEAEAERAGREPTERPVSRVGPAQVKSLMKRLEYPDEAVLEVDTMNELALRDTWGKLQDDFARRKLQGMKIPSKAPTDKGRLQLTQLKHALDVVRGRKRVPEAVLTQLLSNPDKAMLVEGRADELQKLVEEIEKQEGEIATMMNILADDGELSEERFKTLFMILNWKMRHKRTPTAVPATEAEKKLPPGFVIQK